MQYLTNYLCNKLIDQTFRGQSYAFPTTLEFGLFVTQPGKDGSGTEALDDTIWLAEAEDVLVSVGSVTVGVTTTLTETPDILAAGAFFGRCGCGASAEQSLRAYPQRSRRHSNTPRYLTVQKTGPPVAVVRTALHTVVIRRTKKIAFTQRKKT